MKILYLTHTVSWKGGGIFYTAFHQARNLSNRGHEVTIASISPKKKLLINTVIKEKIAITEFPDLLRGKARSGWDLWDTLNRVVRYTGKKFDIIHGFESRPVVSIPGIILRKMHKTPFVLTWADWFGKGGKGKNRGRFVSKITAPIETFFEDYFFPKADYCIAMGEPIAKRAESIGISKNKLMVLMHGCDTEHIRPITKVEARRCIGNISSDEFVLGYLGTLQAGNADLLFDGYSRIADRIKAPSRLILIGNTKLDWKRFPSARQQSNIEETGWITYQQINQYLSACDILALPLRNTVSTDNVWPSKMNDYLAAGRPIVSTRMKVLEQLFLDHKIGLLCDDSPVAFAEACVSLRDDQRACEIMSQNARNLAENELSWDTIVNKLEKFYNTILSK